MSQGIFRKYTTAKGITVFMGWGTIVFLLLSLVLVPFGWNIAIKDHPYGIKLIQAIILACWTLGVPIWFWIEFHWIGSTIQDQGDFKYSQELSSKVWLAASSVLFLLYFWKDLK